MSNAKEEATFAPIYRRARETVLQKCDASWREYLLAVTVNSFNWKLEEPWKGIPDAARPAWEAHSEAVREAWAEFTKTLDEAKARIKGGRS